MQGHLQRWVTYTQKILCITYGKKILLIACKIDANICIMCRVKPQGKAFLK